VEGQSAAFDRRLKIDPRQARASADRTDNFSCVGWRWHPPYILKIDLFDPDRRQGIDEKYR
jgi:hypothetical protein